MKHIIFDCDGTLIDTFGPKYQLFSGIKELLEELSKDCLLYVWTARDRASTLRILEECGIHAYFDSFSTVDDAYPKPNPMGIAQLVGKVPKHSICVIGDSGNDILGAKSFGVLGIGALWAPNTNEIFLRDVGADFLVSHPSECSKLIELNLRGDDHV